MHTEIRQKDDHMIMLELFQITLSRVTRLSWGM